MSGSGGCVVAICQLGGEFATSSDRSLSYTGGEAHAIDIDRNFLFENFKSEISSVLNTDISNMSIKYFLPNNNRTLITISCDKDLQRMIDFYEHSVSVDVYIVSKTNRGPMVDSRTSMAATAMRNTGRPKRGGRTAKNHIPATNADGGHVNMLGVNTQQPLLDAPENAAMREDWTLPADMIVGGTDSIVPTDEFLNYEPTSSNDIITGVGQEFDNVKDFRDKLCEYAICKNFAYRFVKNETARVTAKCTAENCPWRVHASQTTRKKKIVIKKIIDVHTCGGGTANGGQRRVTKKWLVNIIKKKLRDSPECKPKEISEEVFRDYGVNVSYFQVWHAKTEAEKELFNMHVEACKQLPWFCERLLESNPGSHVTLATSADSRFRLFLSFRASLQGFEHGCRPLILLDTIPLQKNNQLKLLAAAAVDGDGGIFPVAFGAVEAENYESWWWFLEQLKLALTVSCPITFVSNRGNGLDQAVPQIFPDSHHGYCLLDIVEDFRTELKKGTWSEKVEDAMVNDLESAALACTSEEFSAHIESIRKVSDAAANWVMSTKPEHWSNALFTGSRYNQFSADIAEFSDWISVRQESSVVLMIYIICCKLMELINRRRETSSAWDTTLTPSVEQKLKKDLLLAQKFEVLCSSDTVFEVRGATVNVVDIGTWDCTCRMWQLSGLPCAHGLAVLDHLAKPFHEYCSRYFTTECYRTTYSESVNQITGVEKISPVIRANLYTPPTRQGKWPRRNQDGRRKRDVRELHCSRCKEVGHNKATCEALV